MRCNEKLCVFFTLFFLLYNDVNAKVGTRRDNSESADKNKLKVCVIGAGAAGLSATRHLSKSLDIFDITVYEQNSDIGGTWIYTDETGYDKRGYPVHSSIYKSLRTLSPKEIMNFHDYPEIKGQNQSCVSHKVVLEYLKNYTNHFDLRPFIQFDTKVLSVKLNKPEGYMDKWEIHTKNLETNETERNIFDAIIICNGHFSDPYIPKIPGIDNFKGQVMHSHTYRVPEIFKDKKVVLLGGSYSGVEIALEVSTVAAQTYLSHNNPKKVMKKRRLGLTEVIGIDRYENGEFILKDNSSIIVDVILFCTGYNFVYPFLDESAEITVDDNYIKPLYKYMFNVEHPSMSFIGIPAGELPFTVFHVQSQFIESVLKNKTQLPLKKVMIEDSKLKTPKKRHYYHLSDKWGYIKELARDGGFAPPPSYYKIGSNAWFKFRTENYGDYKNYNLIVRPDKKSVEIFRYLPNVSSPKSTLCDKVC